MRTSWCACISILHGFKVNNDNEIILTGFADDCSYFLNDRLSVTNLLKHVANFSQISGLEINRTKSECLYIGGEIDPGQRIDNIPIVQQVKVLGYFFGHSKLIDEFHNFYSKLAKMQKLFNIWKQRNLTLFGKNLIINSLMISLIIYPCHVDNPPNEFIKEVKTVIKNFLREAVPQR